MAITRYTGRCWMAASINTACGREPCLTPATSPIFSTRYANDPKNYAEFAKSINEQVVSGC
jgi:hypothetical protein